MKTDSLREESFGASHISGLAEANIDSIAVFINPSGQIVPHTFEPNKRFVNQPNFPDLALSLCPNLFCEMREKALFPIPHRFVSELKISEQKNSVTSRYPSLQCTRQSNTWKMISVGTSIKSNGVSVRALNVRRHYLQRNLS